MCKKSTEYTSDLTIVAKDKTELKLWKLYFRWIGKEGCKLWKNNVSMEKLMNKKQSTSYNPNHRKHVISEVFFNTDIATTKI